MFIEILKAILFGIVEGITEWLPVSSTGHLILLDEFLRLRAGEGLDSRFVDEFVEMFSVVIQLGAILAVVVVFFGRLWPFGKNKSEAEKNGVWSMWAKVAVASIPAALVGIVLDKIIEKLSGKDIDGWIYNAYVVAGALIVYGVLFIFIEKRNAKKEPSVTDISQISYKKAFLIGVFQMLALIPGTSRSGSTILGSMCMGLSRTAAAEISFFMAIPAMAGGSLIKALGFASYLMESSIVPTLDVWAVLAVGFAVAFAVSLVAIRFLMDFVKKHSFSSFGVYRIILGALVLLYFAFGR